jgi:hypothetical protein
MDPELNEAAPQALPIDSMPDDHMGDPVDDTALPADDGASQESEVETEASLTDLVKAAVNKEPVEKAADAPPAPDGKAKDASADPYAIPPGVSREHRARWVQLSSHAKEVETQKAAVEQQAAQYSERLNGFEGILKEAGATPEILSGHLSYINMVKTGNLDGAMDWIERERSALAKSLGRPIDGVDLLDDFPDLRERVDNMQMDEEAALEIAQARRTQAGIQQRESVTARQRDALAASEALEARKAEHLNGIGAMLDGLSKTDVDYVAKEAQMLKWLDNPATLKILGKLPPEDWLDYVKGHYDAVQVVGGGIPPRGQTPLRPGSRSGGAVSPKTDLLTFVKARTGYA